MKPFSRAERVSVKIQANISELLHRKVSDPRLEMVTITGVKLTDGPAPRTDFLLYFRGQKSKV